MKALDRLLQRWRIAVAAPWMPSGARVLDVGCADGALFDLLRGRIAGGVGIDPDAPTTRTREGIRLVRGLFPADAPDERFDAITMLAVVEHLPASAHAAVGRTAARLLGAGGRLGVVTDAVVDHDYDFDKGAAKWRYLERNRWATLIRTYPIALLLLVFPALLATDLALWPVALLGGWGRQRLLALIDTLRSTPRLLRERRNVQATRAIGAGEFASSLTPELNSPYLGRPGRSRFLGALLRGYWSLVLRALGA